MPEGDTIHYAAHRMRPVLEGRVPDELATPHPRFGADRWPEKLAGRAIEAVDAHGKHLFLRFEGGRVIHSHLRMTGAWGVYREGQRWGRSARRAWLVLRAGGPRRGAVRRPRARAHDRLARALRPAHRRPRPRHPRARARRAAASCRACAPTIPRGRSATPCSTSARSRASATCGSARAASTPGSIRGGRRATSPTTRRCASCASRGRACSSPRARASRCAARAIYGRVGRPLPALRRDDPRARAGRRQPHDILVPGMPALKRIGHKGADLIAPGNTLASLRRGAGRRRRHGRVRRAARAPRPDRAPGARPRLRRRGAAASRSRSRRAWPTSPRTPGRASSSTWTSRPPATSAASSTRCASTGSPSARSSRPWRRRACASSARGAGDPPRLVGAQAAAQLPGQRLHARAGARSPPSTRARCCPGARRARSARAASTRSCRTGRS